VETGGTRYCELQGTAAVGLRVLCCNPLTTAKDFTVQFFILSFYKISHTFILFETQHHIIIMALAWQLLILLY
jgi:hypothetical protein